MTTAAANLLEDVECIHGLDAAWCQLCRKAAHVVRRADGDHFESDCAVRAFATITGAEYVEAAELMRAAGFRPGRGAPVDAAEAAFKAAGYDVRHTALDLDQAVALSRTGRCFYVTAQRSRKGHAWAIVDGKQVGAWAHGFRYRVLEVTA